MDGTVTEPKQTSSSAPKARKRGRVELSVHQIIDQAEKQPVTFRAAVCASCLGGVTFWASFPPLDFAPLAWLAILPWLMLIQVKQPPRWLTVASWLGGICWTVPALQWMRYGDPLMYIGWIALAFYLAAYIPLFIGLSRIAVHRWRMPLILAAPVIWTGLEYMRGTFLSGFGWYFLGHTQHRWVELLQISDLVGAYGVSFIIMLFAAAVSLQIPPAWYRKLGLLPRNKSDLPSLLSQNRSPVTHLAIASSLLAATLGYGYWRCSSAEFTPGPRVALVQANFRAQLQIPVEEYEHAFLVHNELTGRAVEHQPDLIVWPEGMFRYALLEADPALSKADLSELAPYIAPESWKQPQVTDTLSTMSQKADAALIIGLGARVATAEGIANYNSAQFVTPDQGVKNRYDKLHRVPFGEYIPGTDLPLLSSLIPQEFGLTKGKFAVPFHYQDWTFAPVICFEDTVPHVTRGIVKSLQKQNKDNVDVLVNLSNDGWFAGSSEHDQHLITAQFRAIELRKPLVRAANMGISSCIDGNGVVMEPEVFLTRNETTGQMEPGAFREPDSHRYRRKMDAVLVQTVPLDSRKSAYLLMGDWFAQLCLACCGLLLISRWLPGAQRRRLASEAAE